MLSRIMGSKASLILLKFLQSINLKKQQHEYKLYIYIYISDKSNFKKLISLLMKIVIIIFNIIIINIIVIENSNEKEFFILR